MDTSKTIEINSENIEVIDNYSDDLNEHFKNIPDVAKDLVCCAQKSLEKIEKLLYTIPSFVNVVKSSIPEISYQAILNNKQKEELAKGTIKLMTKKDGSLMANLIDASSKKIVGTVSLNEVSLNPEIMKSMNDFYAQMQMAQIAEQIQFIQYAVEEVRQGQEYDRLSTGYSCQQKFLQIMKIKNKRLKNEALLNLALSSEDSRNILMLSQNVNIEYVKNQPDSFINKILRGDKQEEINKRINAIRESLNTVNMVSLVEAIAYQEIGEMEASKMSLEYYFKYINKTYLQEKGLVERLDLMDSSPKNYWTNNLPIIKNKIEKLLNNNKKSLIKGENNERNKKEM